MQSDHLAMTVGCAEKGLLAESAKAAKVSEASGMGAIVPAGQGAQENSSHWDLPTRASLGKACFALLEPGGRRAGPITECLSGFGCAGLATTAHQHPLH